MLNRFNKEKYYVLADQVVVSGSAFITNLILARALGLVEYGRFAAIGMIQLFFLSVTASFGSQVYQVVYPSMNKSDQQRYTSGAFYLQLPPAVSILLLWVILQTTGSPVVEKYRDVIAIASIAIALYLLQDFIRKALVTQHKSRKAFWMDTITNGLQVALLLWLWVNGRLNIYTAWEVIGLTFIPSVIAGIYWLKPGLPASADIRLAWEHHKSKSGWLVAGSLLQWCSGYFFVLAAGWWIGSAALGALRLVQYIFGLLNVLLQAIENYALPRAAAQTENPRFIPLLLKKCLFLMLPVLIFLTLFAKQILSTTGGDSYTSYSFLVYGLSLIYLVLTLGYPIRISIRARHLNRQYFLGYMLSVCFSLPVAPWLLRHGGLYGVMSGLMLTQLITLTYWSYILHQQKVNVWK